MKTEDDIEVRLPADPYAGWLIILAAALLSLCVYALLLLAKSHSADTSEPVSREVALVVAGLVMGFVLLPFAVFVHTVISEYNYLSALNHLIEKSKQDFLAQCARRDGLVPAYTKLVERYLGHEFDALDVVRKARSLSNYASSDGSRMEAEGALGAGLKQLFAVVEGYPQIATQANVSALQEELVESENRVDRYLRAYHTTVQVYNTAVDRIPTRLVAWFFNFTKVAQTMPKKPYGRPLGKGYEEY